MIPKRRPFIPKKRETEHRLNRDIRVPEVRLVGEEIEPGVYPIEEALRLAKEQEVDLVEISTKAAPPTTTSASRPSAWTSEKWMTWPSCSTETIRP